MKTFYSTTTGGGCTALQADYLHLHCLITTDDGMEPDADTEEVVVGIYGPDHSEPLHYTEAPWGPGFARADDVMKDAWLMLVGVAHGAGLQPSPDPDSNPFAHLEEGRWDPNSDLEV